MQEVFGIDLGGTKMEGVVLPFKGSIEPLARLRLPTESEKGYQHIVSQLAQLRINLEQASGVKASRIGICTPGTVDPKSGLHKNSNTTCLNEKLFEPILKLQWAFQ